jgi:hypothetical protein
VLHVPSILQLTSLPQELPGGCLAGSPFGSVEGGATRPPNKQADLDRAAQNFSDTIGKSGDDNDFEET